MGWQESSPRPHFAAGGGFRAAEFGPVGHRMEGSFNNPLEQKQSNPFLAFGIAGSGCLFLLMGLTLGALPAAVVLYFPMALLDLIGHGDVHPDAMWGLSIFVSGTTCATVLAAGIVAHVVQASSRPKLAVLVFISVLMVGALLIPLALAFINSNHE
jgi:hypothetical protein